MVWFCSQNYNFNDYVVVWLIPTRKEKKEKEKTGQELTTCLSVMCRQVLFTQKSNARRDKYGKLDKP